MSAVLANLGPGDERTWPRNTGHPNAPDTEDPDEDPEAGIVPVEAHELEEAYHALMAAARELVKRPDPTGLVPRCYRAAGRIEATLNRHEGKA